jgi:hypothetical protein
MGKKHILLADNQHAMKIGLIPVTGVTAIT